MWGNTGGDGRGYASSFSKTIAGEVIVIIVLGFTSISNQHLKQWLRNTTILFSSKYLWAIIIESAIYSELTCYLKNMYYLKNLWNNEVCSGQDEAETRNNCPNQSD